VRQAEAPNAPRDRMAVRFGFNAWGNKYESLLKDIGVIAQLGAAVAAPLQTVDMILEGGSIDVDGQGTLLTTKQCLLNENRNPDMDQAAIETNLKAYLGVQKILWLGDGIEGDDTDGHVDDITRFVAPGVVATCVEEDKAHPNFTPLDENAWVLRNTPTRTAAPCGSWSCRCRKTSWPTKAAHCRRATAISSSPTARC